MTHPNFFDRIFVKINPRYLYPHQIAQTVGKVYMGIVHKLPESKPNWKIMDYIYLQKGSTMRFWGLAKSLKWEGDLNPASSIFEIVSPITEGELNPRHVASGDVISISPSDRRFIYPLISTTNV